MAVTQMWTDLSLDGVNAEKRVPEKKKTRAVPAETMQFQSYPFISGPASE
jgi:hypothetical protein